jgi:hypothetical protein
MEYRQLTENEKEALENNLCIADDWDNVRVHAGFKPGNLFRVRFTGKVKLGLFNEEINLPGGLKRKSGIYNAWLHNCETGNNVLIDNVHNYIANYRIGDNTIICNVNSIYVEGESSFGNGVKVSVLNETGGREVYIYDYLSAHFAYIFSCYRHRPILINKMQDMVLKYSGEQKSAMGTIGKNVTIINAGTIKNVRIGDYAGLEGCRFLENGSINSNGYDPVHIGHSVMINDFIVSSGSRIEDGTMLSRCFVGQACCLGHAYSATDSLFFSNCRGENGEACALFAGPYTVTHHKSTLLIAGMFSFMNAGSGSNQSNHMYKLGPIHQGIVERGGKTTSDSYILWPAKIGAYSLIMGRHYQNSDTSKLPFSYLIEDKGESLLVPGINLRSVGTIRDARKFPKRDKRRDPRKLDCINFNLLSPYTVHKMFQAIEVLEELQNTCGETSLCYTYHSCKIKRSSLEKGLVLYNMAIVKFLGNSLISRLADCPCKSIEEIKEYLKPDTGSGLSDWLDLSGLIAPRPEIEDLIEQIENGIITNLNDVNACFETLHREYYTLEWSWAWDKIKSYFNLSLETITKEDIVDIVEKWKDAVISLDNMIYEDARKEFSLSSRTSFGVDGDIEAQKVDFEQVRGVFEENPFVKAVIDHISTKRTLGDKYIRLLK